jgi:hypothetical protein
MCRRVGTKESVAFGNRFDHAELPHSRPKPGLSGPSTDFPIYRIVRFPVDGPPDSGDSSLPPSQNGEHATASSPAAASGSGRFEGRRGGNDSAYPPVPAAVASRTAGPANVTVSPSSLMMVLEASLSTCTGFPPSQASGLLRKRKHLAPFLSLAHQLNRRASGA